MSRPSIPWSAPGRARVAPHVRFAQAVPDLGLKLEIGQAGRLIDLTSRRHHRVVAILDSAAWALGAFLGAGGFAGSHLGARLQRHLPERTLRRLLGLIACLVAVRYVQTSLQPSPHSRATHAVRG